MSLEDNADDWAKNEADEVVTRPSDSGAAPSYISALAASNPYRPYEWYLDGYLTPGGNAYGADVDAISTQYRGAGVKVGIIDEGFDYRNPDLVGRFDLAASYDPRNPGTQSILPDSSDAMHGTWVSGVIGAAADNNFGTVGVASAATLVGFYARFGSGGSPRAELADLLARQVNDDIANNSWGYTTQFADNFLDPAWSNIRDAIQLGVTEGRGGLGTNYVFAAGNDRQYVPNSLTSDGDNTNDHSLTNTRHDIAVAATTQTGHFTSFSTPGASVLVAAPGESMLTTAPYDGRPANDYAFVSGTSFSAPTVSGVIADMLQANPLLGYRDVQEILAMSARKIDEANSSSWAFNGDNHWNGGADTVSSDYGYGLVDAHAAVRLAETWTIQNNLTKGFGSATAANEGQIDVAGSAGGAVSDMFGYAVPVSYAFTVGSDYSQFHVSRVDLDVSLTTGLGLSPGHLGDLKVELVSPTGTHSILLDQPGAGTNTRSSLTWTFDTTHDFGESPVGTWTVEFSSIPNDGKVSIVNSLALHVYGDSEPAANDVYYFTDQYHDFYDAGRSTITDYSGVNTVNASMVTSNSHIDLRNGYASTIDGETVHLNGIVNVFAGDGNDTLIGNDANDTFWTGTGVDTVHGGAGDDTIYVNNSSDVITDTGGYNTVWSSVDYTLPTGIQQLNLTGPASSGVGNDAGDLFRNETNHNVTFTGGTGNDSYDVGTGDTILERSGGGIDTVCLFKGTDSSYTIPANVENLSILSPISSLTAIGGTSSGNVIDASNLGHGAWIYGGAGNDTITGSSSGQNVIEGGPGADVLHGGPIDILSYVHSDFPVYVNLEHVPVSFGRSRHTPVRHPRA